MYPSPRDTPSNLPNAFSTEAVYTSSRTIKKKKEITMSADKNNHGSYYLICYTKLENISKELMLLINQTVFGPPLVFASCVTLDKSFNHCASPGSLAFYWSQASLLKIFVSIKYKTHVKSRHKI